MNTVERIEPARGGELAESAGDEPHRLHTADDETVISLADVHLDFEESCFSESQNQEQEAELHELVGPARATVANEAEAATQRKDNKYMSAVRMARGKREIMSLPDDAFKEIMARLDDQSAIKFSSTCCRLRALCRSRIAPYLSKA